MQHLSFSSKQYTMSCYYLEGFNAQYCIAPAYRLLIFWLRYALCSCKFVLLCVVFLWNHLWKNVSVSRLRSIARASRQAIPTRCTHLHDVGWTTQRVLLLHGVHDCNRHPWPWSAIRGHPRDAYFIDNQLSSSSRFVGKMSLPVKPLRPVGSLFIIATFY